MFSKPLTIIIIAVLLLIAAWLFFNQANLTEETESTPTDNTENITSQLTDNQWQLVTYIDSEGVEQTVSHDVAVTVQFADGQISGKSGCNNYFGPYEISEDEITFGPVGSTQMFCEGVMDIEQAYLTNLGAVKYYELGDDTLIFKDEQKDALLIFEIGEQATLENSSWIVTGYNNGKGGVTSVVIGTEITAKFVDGQVEGNGGCNGYGGEYTVDGDKIAIGPLLGTQMYCEDPEGVMDQEIAFLQAMQNSTTFKIVDDAMDFRDDSGAKQVGFKVN